MTAPRRRPLVLPLLCAWSFILLPLWGEDVSSFSIEEARRLESYLGKGDSERYLELEGNVAVSVSREGEESLHRIEADRLLYNRATASLYAAGNVRYILEQQGKREVFQGESLFFSLEDASAFFYKGESRQEKQLEEKGISFFYKGESIRRLPDGSVVLSRGTISSSKPDDPYYSIKADRITVLKAGEWAVRRANLYIGRVPVLPLPFFFMPGDSFLLNPSFGYHQKKGYYLQTTSYLRGYPESDSEGGLSLLQYTGDQDEGYRYVRRGLFLTKEPVEEGDEEPPGSIKILADYYHLLGAHLALNAEWEASSLLLGIAASRSIYENSYYGYTTIDPLSGMERARFQHPMLFGVEIPLRFYLDYSLEAEDPLGLFSFTVELPFYSDPGVRSDFYPRKEGLQLKSMLDPDKVLDDEVSSRDELHMELSVASEKELDPLGNGRLGIRLKHFRLASDIDSQNGGGNDIYPLSYYYPSSVMLPDLALLLRFDLIEEQRNDRSDDLAAQREGITPPPPWEEGGNEEEKESAPPEHFIPPEAILSEGVVFQAGGFKNSLGLEIRPSFSLQQVFHSSGVPAAEEVHLDRDYMVEKGAAAAELDYKADLSKGRFHFENSLGFTSYYQRHFDRSDEFSSDYGEDSDMSATKYDLKNSYKAVWKPFFDLENWSDSRIVYQGRGRLLSGRWDSEGEAQFEHIPFEWSEERFDLHRLSWSLRNRRGERDFELLLEGDLPPRDPRYRGVLSFETDRFSLGMENSMVSDGPSWDFDPLLLYSELKPHSWWKLKEKLYLDLDSSEQERLESSVFFTFFDGSIKSSHDVVVDLEATGISWYEGSLKLFPLYGSFRAEREYEYSLGSYGWEKDENSRSFQSSYLKTGILLNHESRALYKGRLNYKISLDSFWEMNLIRYTENRFVFDLGFDFDLAEFLELQLSIRSTNNLTHRYFSAYNSEPSDLFQDLLYSFDFFHRENRLKSNFNLEKISIKAVHKMRDWDLNFVYEGEPVLREEAGSAPEYIWTPEFSIFLQWRPIPELKKEMTYKDEVFES